jgi:hypothetical protein
MEVPHLTLIYCRLTTAVAMTLINCSRYHTMKTQTPVPWLVVRSKGSTSKPACQPWNYNSNSSQEVISTWRRDSEGFWNDCSEKQMNPKRPDFKETLMESSCKGKI